MADRYWRGGAGTWNSTNTTNWSTTSGGAGGASVPTNADTAIFDANSGTGTVSVTQDQAICQSLTVGAFTGTFSGTVIVNSGNVTTGTTATLSNLSIWVTGAGGGTFSGTQQISNISVNLNAANQNYTISGNANVGTSITKGTGNLLTTSGSTITNVRFITASGTGGTATLPTISGFSGIGVDVTCTAGSISIQSIRALGSITCNSSGSVTINAVPEFSSLFIFSQSNGTVTFPAWPTTAQVTDFRVTKTGGTSSPAISSSFAGYSSLSLAGSGINATSVSVSSAGSLTLSSNAFVSTVSHGGSNLAFSAYSSSSTQAIGTCTVTSTNLTIGGSAAGRIGTFNHQVAGATLTINNTVNVFNANTLNIGATPSSPVMIVKSNTPSGTRAIVAANTSYTLRNIDWRGIQASGVIPFTGTNFINGGNNLNITFPATAGSAGLFFGSNF